MNGQAPEDLTADKWFKLQDDKFKEFYLGKGRYELYKDGKISLKDLVSQNGRYLTITELLKLSK
jgi:hypothetical protein